MFASSKYFDIAQNCMKTFRLAFFFLLRTCVCVCCVFFTLQYFFVSSSIVCRKCTRICVCEHEHRTYTIVVAHKLRIGITLRLQLLNMFRLFVFTCLRCNNNKYSAVGNQTELRTHGVHQSFTFFFVLFG